MKATRVTASLIATLVLGSAALAGAASETPVDGVWPLGDAVIGPIEDQRLEVTNIGDSGLDGVGIGADSALGKGLALDLDAVLESPGAACHIERNGEDGLSHGSVDIIGHGDGTGSLVFDYSALDVTEIHIVEHDGSYAVVSDEAFPGPVAEKPIVPPETCPDGSPPRWRWKYVPTKYRDENYNTISTWVWECPDGDQSTYERVVVVTPLLPGGVEIGGAESVSITARGISTLMISESDIAGLDVER